jgi:hypothetical protein
MEEIVFVVAHLLTGKLVYVDSVLDDQIQTYKDLFKSNDLGHDQE